MKNELLKSKEHISRQSNEAKTTPDSISRQETEEIYSFRKKSLETIRAVVCLKFYNEINEKLDNEKLAFEKLLNWQDAKTELLANYSFVLNPYYFEQKFLTAEA